MNFSWLFKIPLQKAIIYFLILTLISTFSFAQNAAVNGGFESWTGGVLDSWTSESGTTLTEENTIVSEGGSSINFLITTQTQGDTDFRQTVQVKQDYLLTGIKAIQIIL